MNRKPGETGLGVKEVLIRGAAGEVHNCVKNPAVVFENITGTLYKIGEYEEVLKYSDKMKSLFREAGSEELERAVVFMELPREQEVIDKVFQITGYVKRYYENEKGNR